MAAGLEPAFASGRPVWPLAGMGLGRLEQDDPHLPIPRGALDPEYGDAPERPLPTDRDGRIGIAPVEPLGPKRAKTTDRQRKWKLALVASCILHASVALVFLQVKDEDALMEGADLSGIAFLGNAPDDQISAGDIAETDDPSVNVTMITMIEAKAVETVEADPVSVEETVEAVDVVEADTANVEMLKPVVEPLAEQNKAAKAEQPPSERVEAMAAKTEPVAPPEKADAVTAEPQPAAPAAEPTPEILATDRPEPVEDDSIVQKPTAVQPTEPVDTASAMPAEVQPAELVETADATPAETIETSTVKPVETGEATNGEPVGAAKAQPSETAKSQPVEVTEIAPTETEPVATLKAEPAPTPVEKGQAPSEPKPVKQAARKPAAEKPAAKPKEATTGKNVTEKASPAKIKKAGNGGKNQADARRGQADGHANGSASAKSKGGKNSAVGNAVVSNYPGKVASKLRRALRYPAEAKRQKLRGQVQVSFVVSAGGGVGSIRVVSSSGSPILDSAAVETVRRAAPFPAIPSDAGRSSWPFTVPLAFTR